jgi:hypothetical protein
MTVSRCPACKWTGTSTKCENEGCKEFGKEVCENFDLWWERNKNNR